MVGPRICPGRENTAQNSEEHMKTTWHLRQDSELESRSILGACCFEMNGTHFWRDISVFLPYWKGEVLTMGINCECH